MSTGQSQATTRLLAGQAPGSGESRAALAIGHCHLGRPVTPPLLPPPFHSPFSYANDRQHHLPAVTTHHHPCQPVINHSTSTIHPHSPVPSPSPSPGRGDEPQQRRRAGLPRGDHLPAGAVAHRHPGPLLLPPLRPLQARHLELVPVGREDPLPVHPPLPGARPGGQGPAPSRALPAPRLLARPAAPLLRNPWYLSLSLSFSDAIYICCWVFFTVFAGQQSPMCFLCHYSILASRLHVFMI